MSYFISKFVTAVRLQFQMMIYFQFFLSNYRRSNKSKNQINSIYSIQSKFSKTESNQFFLDFFQYENIERNDVQNISNRYIGRKKQPLKKTT